MLTLDSLTRPDILKVLKNMFELHSTISGNQRAAQEANNNINNAFADYQQKLKASRVSGKRTAGIILLCALVIYGTYLIVGIVAFFLALLSSLGKLSSALSDSLNDSGISGFPQQAIIVVLIVLIAILIAAIVGPIFLIKRGNKDRKKRVEEFQKSGFWESVNAYIEEQKLLIQIYSRVINEATEALNNYYRQYCVHQDLRSPAALRFCYNEIYSSANMGINMAHQHFIQAVHRENMVALQQQQNEAIERARQQAHADSLAMQRLERERIAVERQKADYERQTAASVERIKTIIDK